MTERRRNFDEEHPYHGMTPREIEEWAYLQQHGHLPGRTPVSSDRYQDRTTKEADEKMKKEK